MVFACTVAAAEANPELEVALISKAYPMRSHTVAAEGGSAAVIKDEDSLDNHFNDTVGVATGYAMVMLKNTLLKNWLAKWSKWNNGAAHGVVKKTVK